MPKIIDKADEIGIRNGKVNEASWWTIWVGSLLVSIGLMGITRSQKFRSMEAVHREIVEQAKST